MAAERLSVRCIRDVLRLHFVESRSPRSIARSLGCGRTTVRDYLNRIKNGELTWETIQALNDLELEVRLGFKDTVAPRAREKPMPDWSVVHKELSKNKNVTLMLLWQEYLESHPQGYKYTQFTILYNRWCQRLSVVMRQNHVAGEKAFVDYCDGIAFVDPTSGEIVKTQLFVGCLGASSYTFAEVTRSQTLPDWLMSHVRMYEFFDRVPGLTIPDNLKSAVTKPCFVEPELNESYRDLANHYGTTIMPAHVRKPRQKAKVEANVLVAQRWILACLRHMKLTSLQEINKAIEPLLEKLNLRLMRMIKKSRRELFETLDLPALKALPETRYEYAEWKKVRVNIDYHVQFDDHFYSVHFTHVHSEMMVRASSSVIEIFMKGERITSHQRSYYKNKHTTKSEHMPENHRSMAKYPPSRLIAWGKSIGPSVGLLIEKMLGSKAYPEQSYRSAMGVIRLEKKYGSLRLETACGRALELQAPTYGFVAKMLQNNMDQAIAKRKTEAESKTKLQESNTRGREYYH